MTATSQNIKIQADGFDLPCSLFVPQQVSAAAAGATADDSPRAAVIVLHDFYGLDEWTQQAAQRLADSGYIAVTPDLFAPTGGPEDASAEGALLDFTLSLYDSRLIGSTLAVVNWLAGRPEVDAGRIAVVGWGWGGACALMAAAHDSRIAVAADIGGQITYPTTSPQKPGSPLNFVASIEGVLFAAFPGKDPQFPEVAVERLKHQLTEHDRRGEVKIYDAPARFWRDDSLPATQRLWQRLETVLAEAFTAPEEYNLDYPNEESRIHA